MTAGTILDEASEFIFGLFKERLSHDYVYHNYQHTFETVAVAERLGKECQVPVHEMEILLLSAWFHDAGYINQYKGHEDLSIEIVKEFLQNRNYPRQYIQEVIDCIDATRRNSRPVKLIHQILCDADIIQIGEESFFLKSDLLKAEWENLNIRACDDLEWEKTQLDFLTSSHFHTHAAQRIYGLQHQKNIQEQRVKLHKLRKKSDKKKKEAKESKAQPKRGIETMFRNLYRGHIELSSIADSKANMMINIHSLIISITLTLVGAKFSIFGTSFKQNQIIIFPIIALLLTSLFSIIFAILSAKPKVTKKITSIPELKENNASILFFGNYTRVSITEFEEEIVSLMKDEDLLYGNMVKDLYYLGKVLRKKYRMLRISYTVFMFGLIFTVLITTFVVIYLKHADDYWPKKTLSESLMYFMT
jgi:hypothetical protein